MAGLFRRGRLIAAIVILLTVLLGLGTRLYYLMDLDAKVLKDHGEAASFRHESLPDNRGSLFDRNGVPLAISAPINNIILDPKVILQHPDDWNKLARSSAINQPLAPLQAHWMAHPQSRYMIAAKNVTPAKTQALLNERIPGVHVEHITKTYYPEGKMAAQLVGFTNANDQGQDGIELSDNNRLRGHGGKTTVERDGIGQVIATAGQKIDAQAGQDLTLSIDSRIQYIAYEALKKSVNKYQADSGSVVVMDPNNGEVLAAVSYPSFNANDVHDRSGAKVRERAITDSFEAGSTIKPFTLGVALQSGRYHLGETINTNPGWIKISGHRVHDDANFGVLTLSGILKKSSNVGVSKIALSMPRDLLYNFLLKAGFGSDPGVNFPAESNGYMPNLGHMSQLGYASLAFGYAFSTSLLQLTRAWSAIANGGMLYPASLQKLKSPPEGIRLMSERVSRDLRNMLHGVVETGGTGLLANIPGYDVAGKTGTTRKVGEHGFSYKRYNAIFCGFAPLDDPKLMIAIRINEPMASRLSKYGGVSAAPVFATIAQRTLEIMGVKPSKDHVDQAFFKHKDRYAKLVTLT